MADTAELIGYGDTVLINDGGAGAYVVIDNVIDFDPPREVLGVVQGKFLSMANRRLTSTATVFDPGQTRIKQHFSGAGWTRVETFRLARTSKNYKFVMLNESTNTTVIVAGFIVENRHDTIVTDEIKTFETIVQHTGIQS